MSGSAAACPSSGSLFWSFLYHCVILIIYPLPLFILNKIVLFALIIYKQFKNNSVFPAPRITKKPVALTYKNRHRVSERNKAQIHIPAQEINFLSGRIYSHFSLDYTKLYQLSDKVINPSSATPPCLVHVEHNWCAVYTLLATINKHQFKKIYITLSSTTSLGAPPAFNILLQITTIYLDSFHAWDDTYTEVATK